MKRREEGEAFVIKCLNVQGLTNQKYLEIYDEVERRVVMCLTETQKKVNNIRTADHLKIIESMREMEDRRGGGIMVIYEEENGLSLDEEESGHRDCLQMKGNFGNETINLTVVYLKTGNGREELEQNREILGRMKERAEEAEAREECYIAVGDFNGHLGYLGYQEENENGKSINRMLEESGLILLNVDEKCEGVFTWLRGESRSAIDLVMSNEKGYSMIKKVKIDEKQEKIDLSDHCMIEIEMEIGRSRREIWNGWTERWFYSRRREKMEEYIGRVENEIEQLEDVTVSKINDVIKRVADEHLKVKYRRKTCQVGKKEEPPWMNEEIRREIAKRRRLNKLYRNGEENREQRWIEYREQKEKVKRMISEEMRKYEEGVAEEIRGMGGGKHMWKMIKKLKGEKVEKRERVKLYTEEGEELESELYEEEIRGFWQDIYQMHGNEIEREWGLEKREEYEEKLARTRRREEDPNELWLPRLGDPYWNVRTMEFEVGEEDIRKVLRELKSGKAGGLDGLKTELYKALAGSNVVVGVLRRGIEKVIVEGDQPESWKESMTMMIPKKKRTTVAALRPIALTDVSYKIVM